MRTGTGKTTTMRMILGLDAPTQDSVTVAGRSYRDLSAPMREVGALLGAKWKRLIFTRFPRLYDGAGAEPGAPFPALGRDRQWSKN